VLAPLFLSLPLGLFGLPALALLFFSLPLLLRSLLELVLLFFSLSLGLFKFLLAATFLDFPCFVDFV
jgi:hypothetical protein